MPAVILENKNFKLTLSESCVATSLINKANGEELIMPGTNHPFFSATQDRPYNNEIKLAYMNKKTTFGSSMVRYENEKLFVKFGLYPFEAQIGIKISDDYMAFTLEKFIADQKDYPQPMDFPPVTELSLTEIAVDAALTYGQWMNVAHTEKSSVAVMATSPHAFIDTEVHENVRILKASARKGIKLIGCTSALIVANKDKLLDAVNSIEHDYDLPLGVESRRSNLINASVYWTYDICPANVDEHIEYAKKGGYRLMLIYYTAMAKPINSLNGYVACGEYDYNENYPNGEADMRLVLDKIKAADITPGMHFLHTHIGIKTKYVTPKADRRLNLTRTFRLSKPLSKDDTTIYVDENPLDCPINAEPCRLLRFDGEIISYESYSTEYPYCFKGCKRGTFGTTVTDHHEYCIGGVLDLTEYSGTSIYLDQNSDLQDEIADKIANIFNLGFKFIYFDGSEGTNAPFEYHVPNAQYRVYKKMNEAPIFCEGAAKAHFGWHILSGGNAFDSFKVNIFKEMIIAHPFTEAEFMRHDHTRVNFGWWAFADNTRVDTYEFGTSKAAAYDCPATMMAKLDVFKSNPRSEDIFAMMNRWEDIRARKLLSEEDKQMLRDAGTEYTLLKNKAGEYEITAYYPVPVADPDAPDAVIGKPRYIGEETEAKSSIRAFVFERANKACAVVWDDKGESALSLATDKIISYSSEIETEDITYTVSNNTSIFPVSSRAYIQSACSLQELASLLKNAKVK